MLERRGFVTGLLTVLSSVIGPWSAFIWSVMLIRLTPQALTGWGAIAIHPNGTWTFAQHRS
jgi:hypothetical protein